MRSSLSLLVVAVCVLLLVLETHQSPLQPPATTESSTKDLSTVPCGYVSSGNRIKEGNITDIGEFPWTALLFYGEPDSATPQCNGAVISRSFVVTAAHCLIDGAKQKKNLAFVRLGEYDVGSNPDCTKHEDGEFQCFITQEDIKPRNILIHPEYQPYTPDHHHDIALIELEHPVKKYTYFIQPICLPEESFEIPAEYNFTVSGWGLTDRFRNEGKSNISSPIKLKEDLPLVDQEQCQNVYGSKISLGSGQLCAGGQLNQDTCQGDSGSPLMMVVDGEKQSNWILVGLVNRGPKECGTEGKPGIYANVKKYVDWIKEHVENLPPRS